MTDKIYLEGNLLDEELRCSLGELCGLCGVPADYILEMIDEGLLEPEGRTPAEYCFRGPAVWRVQTAIRLQRDLRINLPGCALVLDLLEEVAELRRICRYR